MDEEGQEVQASTELEMYRQIAEISCAALKEIAELGIAPSANIASKALADIAVHRLSSFEQSQP